MDSVVLKKDDLKDGMVIELLEAHHKEMHLYSPVESIHSLDKEKFFDPSIHFWSAWVNDQFAACGALMALSDNEGEIKSMRTAKSYLRQGIAEKILNQIVKVAIERKYSKLYLETGTHSAFLPAVKLYMKQGFVETGPFGDYQLDPYSMFLVKEL